MLRSHLPCQPQGCLFESVEYSNPEARPLIPHISVREVVLVCSCFVACTGRCVLANLRQSNSSVSSSIHLHGTSGFHKCSSLMWSFPFPGTHVVDCQIRLLCTMKVTSQARVSTRSAQTSRLRALFNIVWPRKLPYQRKPQWQHIDIAAIDHSSH